MYDSLGNPVTIHLELFYVLLTARIIFDISSRYFVGFILSYVIKSGKKLK